MQAVSPAVTPVTRTARGRRTHVMHVVPEMTPGGLPHVVLTLCRFADAERFRTSVLCINYGGAVADELVESGFDVHQARTEGRLGKYLAFREVARILRAADVDVVHTHNTQAFVDGALGARLAGVRTLVHTDHARLFPDKRRYVIAENVVSRLAHRVVGVSDHTSESLIEHIRIPRRKVMTIPNGIDAARFTRRIDPVAKRRSMGIDPDRPVLGIGARLVPQKAHADLITAMAELRRRHPDALLLIAGVGDLEREIRCQIEALGLQDNVWMLGVRHDMDELLQAFDVFVMPSIWEGLPMVLLEAMATGTPIVASRVGGVPTAVEDGTSGLLVEPRNVPQLVEALDRIVSDAALRARLAHNARARFDAMFTAETMASAYADLYMSALAR